MKHLVLVLLLVGVSASAQQAGDVSEGRPSRWQQATDLMLNVYLRQSVQDACLAAEEVTLQLNGPDHNFVVNCAVRRGVLQAMAEFYAHPGVIEACRSNPAALATATVLGNEIPVNCGDRARYLPMIEQWLGR